MTNAPAQPVQGRAWNAKAEHNWPGGKYVGATCTQCGVSGFMHHKNGPRLCYPHWLESEKEATERKARWLTDMTGEYGPYVDPGTTTISWYSGLAQLPRFNLKEWLK